MPTEYFCKNCGKPLEKDEHPCSKCGSSFRHIKVYLEDSISSPEDTIQGKLKRPGIPGYAYKVTVRNKISGETKRPTKERIIIDRTHPEKTTKTHVVDEQDGKKLKRCHDEKKVYKAKHRKKNVSD